ncbi:MAG: hypothetical protein HYX63_12595 [Gammaproteobacteria bacterium]|nr:hypothetical protein [Gammaproteobacteria bacterium]
MNYRSRFTYFAVAVLFMAAANGHAEQVVARSVIAQNITVENLRVDGPSLRGEIVNRSGRPVEDVQLLVTYDWQWRDEMKPGPDSPAWDKAILIAERLAPNEVREFSQLSEQPLATRGDGEFHPSVAVVGYTEFNRPE